MMTMREARALIQSVITLRNTATDEQALTMLNIFPSWKVAKFYTTGSRLVYNGVLYRVCTDHTSDSTNTPDLATDLYTLVVAE